MGEAKARKRLQHHIWMVQLSRYSDSLRAGRSGDRIPVGASFSAPVHTDLGTNPASYVMGTGSFPGVKRPKRDVEHPTQPSAEVKKEYSYIPTPPLEFSGLFQGEFYIYHYLFPRFLRIKLPASSGYTKNCFRYPVDEGSNFLPKANNVLPEE